MTSSENQILEILRKEPIRFIDGRYSTGFVEREDLEKVLNRRLAEKYRNHNITFIRIKGSLME